MASTQDNPASDIKPIAGFVFVDDYKAWRQLGRLAADPKALLTAAQQMNTTVSVLEAHRRALQVRADSEGWVVPTPTSPAELQRWRDFFGDLWPTNTGNRHDIPVVAIAFPHADYTALREAAKRLVETGLSLQTVIPVVLPATEHPQWRQSKSGNWEIILDKYGRPTPAFKGKNPSFWKSDGTPKLVKHSKLIDVDEVLQHIDIAERLGRPIGLAVIPSTDDVVIDFDLKNYANREALEDDWSGLVSRYPQLANTRIERTPGGGLHVYLRVLDGMDSWRTARGTLHCNFTTTEGGVHRGEVLAGTRVAVCAPTRNGEGCYQLVNPDHAFDLVEVKSLGEIGIYPVSTEPPALALAPSREHSPKAAQQTPALVKLLGRKAKEVLEGRHPYVPEGDRSAQLTGFAKELYSVVNLLNAQGLLYHGSVEDVLQQAVTALDIEDKADRVLITINPAECHKRKPEVLLHLYRELAPASTDTEGEGSAAKMAKRAEPSSLGIQLEQLLAEGLRGAELSLQLKELADAVGSPMREMESLYKQLAEEQEKAAETAETLDELLRLNESAGIDLQALIPPDLLEVLEAMRAFANYRLDVLLAVLMTGLSGALPLNSKIKLNEMENFSQPLSLWTLLLMPSGESKSPLLHRLLELPWKAVDAELDEAYQQRLAEWEADEQQQPQDGEDLAAAGPRPRKPQTLVTEDASTQGLETHMEIHDRWANRSMFIWLDEGKGALKQMVDRDGGTGKETPFGGWLLSRYDGTGARGAKADRSRERNYRSCRLSMVTCCQPDVYRAITGDGDQTGLSARFIVVEQNLVEQDFPVFVDVNAVMKADELHQTLVRCYRELAQTDELTLWLSEEAFELFQLERKAMYDRKRESNSSAERALANKVAGRLGRLAGMFHVLWCLMGPKRRPRLGRGGEISAENMQRAILFNRLLLDQTLGVRLTSADNSAMAGLMLKLHRRAWEVKKPVAVNDLRKALSSKNRPEIADVLQALQELVRRGFGELKTVDYRGQLGWKYKALKPLLEVDARHP